MGTAGSMATGWYALKQGAGAEARTGPHSWEELYGLTLTGGLRPSDLVCNQELPSWLPAAQIPGLFPAQAPAVPVQAPLGTPPPQPYAPLAAQPAPRPGTGEEGCSLAILKALKGKPLPMTMDITVDESGKGSAVTFIDVSSLNTGDPEDGTLSSEPQTMQIVYSGNTLTFQLGASEGMVSSMSGTVSKQGDQVVIKGTLTGSGKGFSMKAVWTVTQ